MQINEKVVETIFSKLSFTALHWWPFVQQHG